MIWEAEHGSSLTFSGTQNSNRSDEGAMNKHKEVFTVFVQEIYAILPVTLKPYHFRDTNNLFLWFIVLVVVHSLKGGWWFGRLSMEARLHSQAHKTATGATKER